jgi:hypothetical protein
MDNFMKNKEILKNNAKRDFSSELRQNSDSQYRSEGNGSNYNDKLAEMKKRLEMLRSQKF